MRLWNYCVFKSCIRHNKRFFDTPSYVFSNNTSHSSRDRQSVMMPCYAPTLSKWSQFTLSNQYSSSSFIENWFKSNISFNQSARSRTVAISHRNIVGLCYRSVFVLECWNFFPGLLTYVSAWGWQRFAIGGHLFSRFGGWRKCVNYLIFHSRQAVQTVSSVFSSSSNQSESCLFLCTSIRIVTSGSSLVAAQNKMQSYFDRRNDIPDKT